MTTPLMNLIWFLVVAFLVAALVWPRSGLLARLIRRGRSAFRVVVEDALKHIYDGEFRGPKATLESKEVAYQLVCQGHDTVRKVSEIMRRTDTPVRRYFRELQREGRIEIVDGKNGCQITWRAT